MTYQVTLFADKYKPVSALVDTDLIDMTNKEAKKKIVSAGVKKICVKRLWKSADLKRYGYSRAKVREYNPEEIKEQAKNSYDLVCAINKLS